MQLKKIVDTETEQKSLPAEADSEQKLKEIEAFLAKSDDDLAKFEEEIAAIATSVRCPISFLRSCASLLTSFARCDFLFSLSLSSVAHPTAHERGVRWYNNRKRSEKNF